MVGEQLTVLVAEDNPDCRDLYRLWLDDYDLRVTENGEAAVDAIDTAVDIVLLDRDMPELTGTEVAAAIDDRACDPYVVMVSSMDPDFDILDVPIDGYVQKPIHEADLQAVIDQCRTQESYQSALDEFFSLTAKLATLEAETDAADLETDERYQRLQERVTEKRAEVDEALAPDQTDWQFAFKTCPTPAEQNPDA